MTATREPPWRDRIRPPTQNRRPDPDADVSRHEAEDDAGLGLGEILRIAWANKWLFLVAAGLGALIAWWNVSQKTPLYRASAQVMIETQQERIVNLQGLTPGLSTGYGTFKTQIQVITSTDVLGRVVDQLSLQDDPEFNPSIVSPEAARPQGIWDAARGLLGAPPPPQVEPLSPEQARLAAIGRLSGKISASHIAESYIIAISVTTSDPQKSADIASAVAKAFVASQREAKYQALEDALTWLGARIGDLKRDVETAQEKIEEFVSVSGLVSPEAVVALTQRLKSMRDRGKEHHETAEELRQRVDQLTTLRAAGDFSALAEALDEPAMRRAALAAGPEASDADAVQRFDALFATFLERNRADAKLAEDRAEKIGPAIAELERELDAQSSDLMALEELNREAEASRLLYDTFVNRYKELAVQRGIQDADSQVIALAHPPSAPAFPNVQRDTVQGGVIGLFIAAALIFLRHSLQTTIRTPEELETLSGLPVLGAIPDHPQRRPEDLVDVAVKTPQAGLAEAVRNLRMAIQLSDVDARPQVVAITSSAPKEGKSVLASLLAITSRSGGRKVLLIDADLRRRSLSSYFRIAEKDGLVSVVSGDVPFQIAVQRDLLPKLDFLAADKSKVHPVDLFESRRFAELLADLREQYDLIVIDTPPVLVVPDTRAICRHVDAVLYSVRWNWSKRRMVKSGLAMLRHVHIPVSGLALTRIDPRQMNVYGYYGYGYDGYGYGYGEDEMKTIKGNFGR